jgi:hypothetical protein
VLDGGLGGEPLDFPRIADWMITGLVEQAMNG